MSGIPQPLKDNIARNIRLCRKTKFPGRGGGKRCAEAFSHFIGKNVSPQQWSPWESGMRTPGETRLEQIAVFFGTSVEWMRRDNRPAGINPPPPPQAAPAEPQPYASMPAHELLIAMGREGIRAVYQVEVSVSAVRFLPCGAAEPAAALPKTNWPPPPEA